MERIAPNNTDHELNDLFNWLRYVCDYNVTTGKLVRALSIVQLNRILANNNHNADQDNPELSRVMAWIMEMIQGLAVIVDDIMDESITRRRQLCWHKKVV